MKKLASVALAALIVLAGVKLVETPIASDAFVFIVNKNNPVRSLTAEQIRKIYTGEITNWSQAGGGNAEMKVFTRPRNSGSEEIFRTLVMKDVEPAEFPEAVVNAMVEVFYEVTSHEGGLCYTFDNYKNIIARRPDSEVPRIAVNGVFPDERNVRDGSYPFISRVHVAIRSDLDRGSMAYKLYEWLLSDAARSTIAECGFLPDWR
jgi:phosphate transport system substrate-binding protein